MAYSPRVMIDATVRGVESVSDYVKIFAKDQIQLQLLVQIVENLTTNAFEVIFRLH